jgi:hypothetical protein
MMPAFTLEMITQAWREKAARLRDNWKHHRASGDAAMHAAAALEACAEEIESYRQNSTHQPPQPDL